jgi:Uma2 family endonuclease
MTTLTRAPVTMTEAEYLEFERASELKHEYIDGEVLAITGASESHNLICASVLFQLYGQLRGRLCKVYPGDMRVRVGTAGLYTYPDISVVCEEPQFADAEFDTLLNPILLIEVLSPSTEGYDRGVKFQHYRELASLQEYLLISQDSPLIERYLRQENGIWQLTDAKGLDASLELSSIGCTLALGEVYEQVNFDTQGKS